MSYGADGIYNEDLLVSHINSDLANDLGNLLSRTMAMTEKYFNGVIPAQKEAGDFDQDLIDLAVATPKNVEAYMNKLDFSRALEEIWKLVSRSNKYIENCYGSSCFIDARNSQKNGPAVKLSKGSVKLGKYSKFWGLSGRRDC
jgi:methionyl-tRNA synthetase